MSDPEEVLSINCSLCKNQKPKSLYILKRKVESVVWEEGDWTERARELCSKLSLKEKLSQLSTPAAAVPRVPGFAAFNWWSGEHLLSE